VKALTVRQPYAWAIAAGAKTIENRSRPTKHRGPLAIHAGAAWSYIGGVDDNVLDELYEWMTPTQREQAEDGIDPDAFPALFTFRAVIATVDVVGCHRAYGCCLPWGQQGEPDDPTYHWVLANAHKPDVPVPAKGRLGLWAIDLAAVSS
jgi:hypothetical protein